MIACPICARPTAVVETRAIRGGTRRRRKCLDTACTGRVTTVEIVVEARQGFRLSAWRLRRAAAALKGKP